MSEVKRTRLRRYCRSGFTLIELIVVIVMMGIVAGTLTPVVAALMDQYFVTSSRVRMVSNINATMDKLAYDLRHALPNSVRVSSPSAEITVMELVPVFDGGIFRQVPSSVMGSPTEEAVLVLDGVSVDDEFEVLAGFSEVYKIADRTDRIAAVTSRELVVYNTANDALSRSSVYAGHNRVAIQGYNPESMMLSFSPKAMERSSTGRFHLVEPPVAYLCDENSGTIIRYTDYGFVGDITTIDSDLELAALGASSTVLTQGVTDCRIVYDDTIFRQMSIVKFELEYHNPGVGRETLYRQVQVINLP